jgi:hypothetical protein
LDVPRYFIWPKRKKQNVPKLEAIPVPKLRIKVKAWREPDEDEPTEAQRFNRRMAAYRRLAGTRDWYKGP